MEWEYVRLSRKKTARVETPPKEETEIKKTQSNTTNTYDKLHRKNTRKKF